MPITPRSRLVIANVVYTTGNYYNPNWITALSPSKVGNTTAQWNADKLQGVNISTTSPAQGEVLTYNGTSWIPSGISTAAGSTSGIFLSGSTTLDGTSSGVLSDTSVTAIDSSPIVSGDLIKYITKSSYSADLQGSEIILVSDGTTVSMSEYGLIYSSDRLVTFSADMSGTDIVLYGQAVNANTTVKLFKTVVN